MTETCPSMYAECPDGDQRCILEPGHGGSLHLNKAGFAWDDAEAAASAVRASEAERDQAAGLLERALFLRQNGERPPGAPRDDLGAETWHRWELDAETFLRRLLARPPEVLAGETGSPA